MHIVPSLVGGDFEVPRLFNVLHIALFGRMTNSLCLYYEQEVVCKERRLLSPQQAPEWSCRYTEARACVKLGLPLNVADGEGNTPLMLACREGHGRLVKLFVRKGADVAAHNLEGMTAEQLALSRRHTGIVKFLHESKNAS